MLEGYFIGVNIHTSPPQDPHFLMLWSCFSRRAFIRKKNYIRLLEAPRERRKNLQNEIFNPVVVRCKFNILVFSNEKYKGVLSTELFPIVKFANVDE